MKNNVDVLIRTEASEQIGHGHVIRCSSIAQAARSEGLNVSFLSTNEYTIELLHSMGEKVIIDQKNCSIPKYVIRDFKNPNNVDNVKSEIQQGSKVLLIDEQGPARTFATYATDALITTHRKEKYDHSDTTKYLYGLTYAPLKKQFSDNHLSAKPGQSEHSRLFISFGGADPEGMTSIYINALDKKGFRGSATIVTTKDTKDIELVKKITQKWNDIQVLHDIKNIADYMANCDLTVTKLGMTTLESFCIGIGCIHIEPTPLHLELQLQLSELYRHWPIMELGLVNDIDFDEAAAQTLSLLNDKKKLIQMGQQGATLIDGHGAQRLLKELLKNDK